MVESVREIGVRAGAKIERETRFYIASLGPETKQTIREGCRVLLRLWDREW